ncbi:hypothetical protein SAMN05920897_10198 [Alkalispirochaeta americana]|uniref:Uncharacterized protein n=1 Tax=Alkalispirochaeta americana TaxID=159291 RepID=A0A1N6N7N6_9SPIO|nr:hypothetical protein [Alkalispirochaeta americana]SIP88066.1 hypothetical protein SAMN05920897_10198 [Alkalispirochaeta americana]
MIVPSAKPVPIVLLTALLLLGGAAEARAISADDLAESIDAFVQGALRLHINARLVSPDQEEAVWSMDLTRATIGGRSVRVRLDGTGIVVVADFTPYWESENELLLVAQGQTWISDSRDGGETTYRTSFITLPIRLGEPIIFLPLGAGTAGADEGIDTDLADHLNIELEVSVERYQS